MGQMINPRTGGRSAAPRRSIGPPLFGGQVPGAFTHRPERVKHSAAPGRFLTGAMDVDDCFTRSQAGREWRSFVRVSGSMRASVSSRIR